MGCWPWHLLGDRLLGDLLRASLGGAAERLRGAHEAREEQQRLDHGRHGICGRREAEADQARAAAAGVGAAQGARRQAQAAADCAAMLLAGRAGGRLLCLMCGICSPDKPHAQGLASLAVAVPGVCMLLRLPSQARPSCPSDRCSAVCAAAAMHGRPSWTRSISDGHAEGRRRSCERGRSTCEPRLKLLDLDRVMCMCMWAWDLDREGHPAKAAPRSLHHAPVPAAS